jgi:hypothetical protein
LEQQRRERVPHLVWTAAMETRGVQHAVERLSHVRFVERRAGGGYEYPFGQRLTATEPFRALSSTPQAQFGAELARHVYAAALMIFGRRQLASHEVATHLNEASTPVQIGPLEGQ